VSEKAISKDGGLWVTGEVRVTGGNDYADFGEIEIERPDGSKGKTMRVARKKGAGGFWTLRDTPEQEGPD
jgi:hypothetical protein